MEALDCGLKNFGVVEKKTLLLLFLRELMSHRVLFKPSLLVLLNFVYHALFIIAGDNGDLKPFVNMDGLIKDSNRRVPPNPN